MSNRSCYGQEEISIRPVKRVMLVLILAFLTLTINFFLKIYVRIYPRKKKKTGI